jgi:ABC-type transporter Mla maintaining outer membrane lipid asymmetry ATPase subunit MlaF
LKNVEYLSNEYAVVDENGEVNFEQEGEKLCLINTEIVMLKEGKVIFTGKDDEFHASNDEYIRTFVRGK